MSISLEKKITENIDINNRSIYIDYELSLHEEISYINESKKVILVKNRETGELRVKKTMSIYDKSVYELLRHNNRDGIPRIYFCEETVDNKLIVIEEYIHGKNLEQLFEEKGVFNEIQAMKYAIEICEILKSLHFHTPQIIHRDLKLSNIIINNDNIVKLIDFNSSKIYKEEQKKDTVLMGTRNFAAPEQYGFMQSDERTDIYGIGVVLLYLLTGSFPQEVIYKGKLGDVIRKATEMDPSSRYQNVIELKRDLEIVLWGMQTKDIPVKRRKKFYSTNKTERNIQKNKSNIIRKIINKIVKGFGIIVYLYIMLSVFFIPLEEGDGFWGETPYGFMMILYRIYYMSICTGFFLYASNYKWIREKILGKRIPFFAALFLYLLLGILHMLIVVFLPGITLYCVEVIYYSFMGNP